MPETVEQIQRNAFARGQQMKQWHLQEQRVLSPEALAILATDFAQVSLFKSNHHLTEIATHERAGLCVRAFEEGYRSPLFNPLRQTTSTLLPGDDVPSSPRKGESMEPIQEDLQAESREPLQEDLQQELRILQIMPALPGWEAVWGNTEEPEQDKSGYFSEPVVCWALVEAHDGRRFVTAMAPDLETSELKLMLGMGNFLGYATPTYSLDWKQLAAHKRTEQRAERP